jgi:hypothetical protein
MPRNCAASVSRAALAANQAGSPLVTGTPRAVIRRSQASSAFPARTISAGRRRSAASSSAWAVLSGASPSQNSPVDTSTSATPSADGARCAESRKLLAAPSRNCVSVIVPGVITRTTSRLTSFRPLAGASICSQTATF